MENRDQQDRDKTLITDAKQINAAEGNAKVIEWEDFEHELARLWSLTSALKEANEKKQSLQEKLQAFIQVTLLLIKIRLQRNFFLRIIMLISANRFWGFCLLPEFEERKMLSDGTQIWISFIELVVTLSEEIKGHC